MYLGDDVGGVKQELKQLARGSSGSPLLKSHPERGKRGRRPSAEGGDLIPEVSERGAHARGGGVDALEAGAEADEVGVVAVDESHELGAERGKVGAELGGQALERDVGAELGHVGVRVEAGAEERVGLEPGWMSLDRLPEEVRGWRGEIRRHGGGVADLRARGGDLD